jgi:hypothetical protein
MGVCFRTRCERLKSPLLGTVLIAALLSGPVSAHGATQTGGSPGGGPLGVTLSLRLTKRIYVRGELTRVIISLVNRSGGVLQLSDRCPYGFLHVQVRSTAGAVVFPPSIPGAPPQSCPAGSLASLALPSGHAYTETDYVVARGRVFLAMALVTLSSGQFMTVASRRITVELVKGPAPKVNVLPGAKGPFVVVTPTARPRGPLYAAYWIGCRSVGRGFLDSSIGLQLTPEQGTRVYPVWSSLECPPIFTRELHAVVGWVGSKVAYVNYVGH